jgi:uncharacterized hydrophobic protein (TIGR00271 family)
MSASSTDAPAAPTVPEGHRKRASYLDSWLGQWDRPAIFDDVASAATETGWPYWVILVLSAAIATLGLAQDSAAVVIGAMLIAPLLAPIAGLGLALAVGDGRLAVQTALVVALSTAAVVATGALLTVLLPFQTVTAEISARTRPTTLDLAVAVFSGLAGATVSICRGKRLSAAVPGGGDLAPEDGDRGRREPVSEMPRRDDDSGYGGDPRPAPPAS